MEDDELEGFRLSPQQRHLWRLQQFDGVQPYRSVCALRIDGPLDVEILERVLNELVQRHEVLRTTVRCVNASFVPVQLIHEQITLDIKMLASFDEHVGKPFHPFKGSLWTSELIRLAKDQHVLLLTASAMVLDEESLRNLAKELSELLGGSNESQDALQFADLAEWQTGLLELDEASAGIDYWRTRPVEQAPKQSALKPAIFSAEISFERLKEIPHTTLPEFLLACWQVYCWRLSAISTIGVRYNGRPHDELSRALGPFEKYLPICSDLQPELSFRSFLAQLTGTLAEANEWQECFAPELIHIGGADEQPFWLPHCFHFTTAPETWTAGNLSFSIDH
jgi:hypothetical protein